MRIISCIQIRHLQERDYIQQIRQKTTDIDKIEAIYEEEQKLASLNVRLSHKNSHPGRSYDLFLLMTLYYVYNISNNRDINAYTI